MHRFLYVILLGILIIMLGIQDQLAIAASGQALQLSIRRVNPGGSVSEEKGSQGTLVGDQITLQNTSSAEVYMVNSGQAASIPINHSAQNPPDPANTPEEKAYKDQLADLSQQIADKVTAKQAKQHDLDTEVYIVARPALGIEVQNLDSDLQNLQEQRLHLEAQHTATQIQQKNIQTAIKAAPPAPSSIINVTPVLKGDKVTLYLSNNKAKAYLNTTLGQWVKAVVANPKLGGQDIWIKVDLAENQNPVVSLKIRNK